MIFYTIIIENSYFYYNLYYNASKVILFQCRYIDILVIFTTLRSASIFKLSTSSVINKLSKNVFLFILMILIRLFQQVLFLDENLYFYKLYNVL